MSDPVRSAIEAVEQERVRFMPERRLYEVEGHGGTYEVKLEPTCTCPAGQHGKRCYHILAAAMVAHRNREGQTDVAGGD